MFGSWQIKAALALGVLLLLAGIWLHGRAHGIDVERARLSAANAAAMQQVIERQAETARTMGEAVRLAHERENAALDARRQAELRRQQMEGWQAEQMARDQSCAEWAAARVGCRLRPEAVSRD